MIKWPITYVNYNGVEVTEDYYFNLNKAELTQMQFEVNGAYSQYIQRIMNHQDLKTLGEEFKKLILRSYGERSDDGRYFRKSEERARDFEQSEAFSTLFMELITNAESAARFAKGILPSDLQEVSNSVTNQDPKLVP